VRCTNHIDFTFTRITGQSEIRHDGIYDYVVMAVVVAYTPVVAIEGVVDNVDILSSIYAEVALQDHQSARYTCGKIAVGEHTYDTRHNGGYDDVDQNVACTKITSYRASQNGVHLRLHCLIHDR
jgi:hypothetical protein